MVNDKTTEINVKNLLVDAGVMWGFKYAEGKNKMGFFAPAMFALESMVYDNYIKESDMPKFFDGENADYDSLKLGENALNKLSYIVVADYFISGENFMKTVIRNSIATFGSVFVRDAFSQANANADPDQDK